MCTEHPYNAWTTSPCVTCRNAAIYQPLWEAERAAMDRKAYVSSRVMGRMVASPGDNRRRASIASAEAARIARAARDAS